MSHDIQPEYREVLIALWPHSNGLWPDGEEMILHPHVIGTSWEDAMACRPLALKRVRIQVGEFDQLESDAEAAK